MYGNPLKKASRAYSNIIAGLLRKYFPRLVDLPTGGRDVAWSWRHYSYAPDPHDRHENMQEVVVHRFWVRGF